MQVHFIIPKAIRAQVLQYISARGLTFVCQHYEGAYHCFADLPRELVMDLSSRLFRVPGRVRAKQHVTFVGILPDGTRPS